MSEELMHGTATVGRVTATTNRRNLPQFVTDVDIDGLRYESYTDWGANTDKAKQYAERHAQDVAILLERGHIRWTGKYWDLSKTSATPEAEPVFE